MASVALVGPLLGPGSGHGCVGVLPEASTNERVVETRPRTDSLIHAVTGGRFKLGRKSTFLELPIGGERSSTLITEPDSHRSEPDSHGYLWHKKHKIQSVQQIKDEIRRWWQATTDPVYLKSRASRRPSRPYFCCAFCMLLLMSPSIVNETGAVSSRYNFEQNMVMCAAISLIAWLPTDNVACDFLLVSVGLVSEGLFAFFNIDHGDTTLYQAKMQLYLLWMLLMGSHSSSLLFGAVSSSAMLLCRSGVAASGFCFGNFIFVVASMLNEYQVVSLTLALDVFLSKTVSGKCKIDRLSGEVKDSDLKFQHLFGDDIDGKDIRGYIEEVKNVQGNIACPAEMSSKEKAQYMFDRIPTLHVAVPPVVKFKTNSVFSAHLVTYKSSHETADIALILLDDPRLCAGCEEIDCKSTCCNAPMAADMPMFCVNMQDRSDEQIEDLLEELNGKEGKRSKSAEINLRTLLFAYRTVRAADGGLLVAVVPPDVLPRDGFHQRLERAGVSDPSGGRSLKLSNTLDERYMEKRLRESGDLGKSILSDASADEVKEALLEFAEHTQDDRWPKDHPGQGHPKDGCVVFAAGRVVAACRRLDHPPQRFHFHSAGTRHSAALGLAEWLGAQGLGGVVFIRSESGKTKVIVARDLAERGVVYELP